MDRFKGFFVSRSQIIAKADSLQTTAVECGILKCIRSDNGPELIAKDVRSWLSGIGVKTAYLEPSSPWENGFCESFNGALRDDLLDR